MKNILFMIALAVAVAGCSRQHRPAPTYSVTDDAGRTVAFAAAPQRIVALAPSATELVFALGRGDRVVGVTAWCDYPPQAKQLPQVGDAASVNPEKLLALRPDCAIMVGTRQSPALATLESLHIPTVVLDPKSPADVIHDLRLLGTALSCSTTADSLARQLQTSLNEIWTQTQLTQAQRPFVFAEIGINPLYTASDDSYIGRMIALAGGRNIAGKMGPEYAAINAEAVIAANPDVILVLHPAAKAAEVSRRIGWAGIGAVRNNRVYDNIDLDVVLRPGPRFVQGLRELHGILYAPQQ